MNKDNTYVVDRTENGPIVRSGNHLPSWALIMLHDRAKMYFDENPAQEEVTLEFIPKVHPVKHEPWVPYLVDRADGVKGHYAIGRMHPAGYQEVWNLWSHCWSSASEDVLTLEQAQTLLKSMTLPSRDLLKDHKANCPCGACNATRRVDNKQRPLMEKAIMAYVDKPVTDADRKPDITVKHVRFSAPGVAPEGYVMVKRTDLENVLAAVAGSFKARTKRIASMDALDKLLEQTK